jgi:hypothetical protein
LCLDDKGIRFKTVDVTKRNARKTTDPNFRLHPSTLLIAMGRCHKSRSSVRFGVFPLQIARGSKKKMRCTQLAKRKRRKRDKNRSGQRKNIAIQQLCHAYSIEYKSPVTKKNQSCMSCSQLFIAKFTVQLLIIIGSQNSQFPPSLRMAAAAEKSRERGQELL